MKATPAEHEELSFKLVCGFTLAVEEAKDRLADMGIGMGIQMAMENSSRSWKTKHVFF